VARLDADVLVIGSGPAGAAAARTLGARGHHVVLVDRQRFPRDKVCGDALIPDALRALARLGLRAPVLDAGRRLTGLRVHAPNGSSVTLAAELACLPRRRLDELLRAGAEEAGARFLAPCELARPFERQGRVSGAEFAGPPAGEGLRVEAPFTILATGAAARPLELFGVLERHAPSAVAARVYYQAPESLAAQHDELCIAYDRRIRPGYGWIFPGPGGVFNLGAGYFQDARSRPQARNLRQLLALFLATFEPARAIVSASRRLTEVRGAPLRTGLAGSRLSRPGLLVVGEAAGMTYSFSGEGIGKALESGILAGEVISAALRGATSDAARVAEEYAARVASAFGARFRAYKLAQDWLSRPLVADFLAWRVRTGRHARQQLEALLAETADPAGLFSVPGLLRSLMR